MFNPYFITLPLHMLNSKSMSAFSVDGSSTQEPTSNPGRGRKNCLPYTATVPGHCFWLKFWIGVEHWTSNRKRSY